MRLDELFEQRQLVAEKLRACLKEKGFTKVSFAKRAGISRPTLDRLLQGSIDSKSTFDKHMRKLLPVLHLQPEELLRYRASEPDIQAVYSNNAPEDYRMSERAQEQYNLLMDVLDLCGIYY